MIRRLWYIVTGRRQEADLAEELAFHREMKAQELRDAGMSEPEIAAATQRALGNDLSARQQARDVWVWPWLQDISQDIRFGVRILAKDRRFTLAAVLALGLGIGVNNTSPSSAANSSPLTKAQARRRSRCSATRCGRDGTAAIRRSSATACE